MIRAPKLTGVMMSNLFWLNDEQLTRLKSFFPDSHVKPRDDNRRVLSEIISINRNGCDGAMRLGSMARLRPSRTDGSGWGTRQSLRG